jgi:hypothetical protein
LVPRGEAVAEGNNDQVGIVFPALDGEQGFGAEVAYFLKLGVETTLRKRDPKRSKVSLGSGITYWIPAPLRNSSPEEGIDLAMLNGLQGTVWGTVYPLPDGVAVQAFLVLAPPYRDYREHRLEDWSVTLDGVMVTVGPPRSAVVFSPALFNRSVLADFGDPRKIKHCPKSGGPCEYFDTFGIERAYGFSGDQAIVRRGGIDYIVQFPNKSLLQTDIIDYTAMVIAWYRGDWNGVIERAQKLIKNSNASTSVVIDAYLYRGAAKSRLGQSGAADFKAARDMNPSAERVLAYAMVGLVSDVAAGLASRKTLEEEWDKYKSSLNPKGPLFDAMTRLVK